MSDQRKSITISDKLYSIISERIKNPVNGFDSVEAYVDYVLEEVLVDDENSVDAQEKKRIQEELKKLGYV
ncbi:MAG: hypothetical protein EB150_08930 [Nitrososphaeria archaeon]|nr:hypothetical protein [Nitrososphaeria archaeon]NDB51649.1 hypothetical protein [Nitrosopumilaceae archaeon]NDB88598.1 hypothetical protein [Nitrososphaerota archaeon]NDB47184.1 hypothetical protein [Nitrososphaeria archaeon]NDB90347.1 hypothetical protein [Nitrososphaerota archaeon]